MNTLALFQRNNITLLIASITAVSLLSGCIEESDKDDNFNGYMPKFAVDSVKGIPEQPLQISSAASAQKSSNIQASKAKQAVNTPTNTLTASAADDTSTDDIEFEAIDCTKAIEFFNAAPQANNFSNSSLDFIRNLQSQTAFYYCVTRQQVFNQSAQVTAENAISTVTSESSDSSNSYFVSWNMPTSVLSASQNIEQQVDSQGILINLQPGIDNTKTRVELAQTLVNNEFSKRIRSTLQDRLTSTTNIRSVTVNEVRSITDTLIQQNIRGRIIFDNKLSVLTAAIKPSEGAVTYLKQCETSPTGKADDYLRECTSAWDEVVYDPQWKIITDVNIATEIKSKLNIATDSIDAGAASIGSEQKFYNDEAEDVFFSQRALPEALVIQ